MSFLRPPVYIAEHLGCMPVVGENKTQAVRLLRAGSTGVPASLEALGQPQDRRAVLSLNTGGVMSD